MDWLRRNWPDLLIGIALLAVIAGIVATLLTGGSFFPINSGGNPSPTVTAPSVDPVPPSTDPAVPPGSVEATPPASDAATPDASTPGASPSDANGDGTTAGGGGAVAVLPPTSGSDAAADDAPSTSTASPSVDTNTTPPSADAPATSSSSGASTSSASTSSASTSVASTSGAGATAPSGTATGNEGLPTAPYRVSVGAFGSDANAQGQAARFRDAGFPVFIGRQGDLYLVLVGPYETEGEAEQAVARIRTGDFGIDPVIYRFQPDDEGAAGATAEPSVTAESPAPSESAPAPSPTPTATAEGTFLQIGAYGTRESALPQIERMEELGFEVSERTEGGLIKLLVGPFTGADLTEARQILQDEGIEHFAR